LGIYNGTLKQGGENSGYSITNIFCHFQKIIFINTVRDPKVSHFFQKKNFGKGIIFGPIIKQNKKSVTLWGHGLYMFRLYFLGFTENIFIFNR